MALQPRSFPFRWVLPFAQLLVCLAVLWPMRSILFFEVSQNPFFGPILQSGMMLNPGLGRLVEPPSGDAQVIERQWEMRRTVPAALNFPILYTQLPYMVLNPEKEEWVPKGMEHDVWRALSWPLGGMFFWWFAGQGIEALRAACQSVVRPRITWIETLVAAVFVAVGIVAVVAILTSTPDDRHDFKFITLMAGAILWGFLAAPTVAARFLQWRVAKRRVTV